MRVLVVSQYFWPETFRVNDLVAELDRRGHEVTVLTGVPNYPEGVPHADFRRNPERYSRYGRVRVVRVPMFARSRGNARLILNYLSFALSGSVIGAWRVRGTSFDAVFVFQPSPITSCLPAIACGRLAQAPVLLWVLDLWPETLSAVGVVSSPKLIALVGALVRFVYRRCSLVLGQSRAFKSHVDRYAGEPSRFQYFPSWAEPVFSETLESVRAAAEVAPYAGTGFNILFAGNIGEAQDFPTILEAAALLRDRTDIRWLIVGDGRAASMVRSEIGRLALEKTVILVGRFSVERMPEFFCVADVLLVTLRKDPVFAMTLPGKLQAYLAAGLPILGALDGEGARVINEACAGLVAGSGDAHGLASQALKLAELPPDVRSRMGASGREYCRREFDRDTLVAQLEALMQRSADEHVGNS